MLAFDAHVPPEVNGSTVLVLLHGRGSHRGDLQGLAPHLPEDWALLTPQAPHAGGPWGYGPGWAWYRYLAEDRLVDDTLARSLEGLDAFLEELPALVDFDPDHVVLGGFSQGGTTSLAWALTRPGRVSAVVNFSGFLADTELISLGAMSTDATPVFWGHGTHDPNIPFALARGGREKLASRGVPLATRDYEIGHWIVPEEVADAVAFVRGVTTGS